MGLYLKDPQAEIDYIVDWGAQPAGRTIAVADWAVNPAEAGGIAILDDSIDGQRMRATLAGGVSGHVYRVTAQASFSDGRIDERSLVLRVEER